MGTISVILPCYNVSQYLERSIGSVLRQTRRADEIIAADDCSRDDTVAMLKRFGSPVQVLTSAKNEGPAARRNDAIRQSTGDYIALLDPDDWWTDDHLELVAELLDRFPEAGVAYSKVFLAGDASGSWPGFCMAATTPEDHLFTMMRNPVIQASSVVFRRSLFERSGPFVDCIEIQGGKKTYGWGGDYEWLLRAAALMPFACCDQPTAYYFIRPGEKWPSPEKLTQIHRYRLSAMRWIREKVHPRGGEFWRSLEDRHRLAWEEDLERTWSRRELYGLGGMCRFGLGVAHLRRSTLRYVHRAWLGKWIPMGRKNGPHAKGGASGATYSGECRSASGGGLRDGIVGGRDE